MGFLRRRPRSDTETAQVLFQAAVGCYQRGELERALDGLQRALAIFAETAPTARGAAVCLSTIGLVYQALGDLDSALQASERALAIEQTTDPSSSGTAACLNTIAGIEDRLGEPARALAHREQAASIAAAIDPASGRTAALLNNLGTSYRLRGELERARASHERALALFEQLAPPSEGTAACLFNLGLIDRDQDRVEQALDRFEQALAIFGAVAPASDRTADCLTGLGEIYRGAGEFERALEYIERALTIFEALSPTSSKTASCLVSIGFICAESGGLDRAKAAHERALAIHQGIAPTSKETAACLVNVGGICREQGDLERARKSYEQALAIMEAIAPSSLETGLCLNELGHVHRFQGELEQALECCERALVLSETAAPASDAVATSLNNLGLIYYERGELAQALSFYEKALAIHEQINPESDGAAAYCTNIGLVMQDAGEFERALRSHERALSIDQAHARATNQTSTYLCNMGTVHQELGAFTEALECYEKALTISEGIAPVSSGTASCLNNIASIHRELGGLERALDYYGRALAIDEAIAPVSMKTAIRLNNVAFVYRRLGQLDPAIAHLERTVELVESLRATGENRQIRADVFAQYQSPFAGLIACLFERGRVGDQQRAFELAERSRARGMVELLAERSLTVEPETNEQRRLLSEEQRLQDELAAVARQLSKASDDVAGHAGVLAELAAIEHEGQRRLERLEIELRRAFPAYAELRYPQPLGPHGVQAGLEPEVLLLEYALVESGAFVWAVGRGRFCMHNLAASAEEIEALVERAIGAYRTARPDGDGQAVARLAELVLGPIAAELSNNISRLVIVPDGALYYLPFELLSVPGGGALLGDRWPVAYAPSASVLVDLRRSRQPRDRDSEGLAFLGFGIGFDGYDDGHRGDEDRRYERSASRAAVLGADLGPIPYARDEVEAIAAQFTPSSVSYCDEDATEWRVRQRVPGCRFVHFATHALIDDRNPMYSGLVLAPPRPDEPVDQERLDDFLQTYEMFKLKLSADVVVCSACETGRGQLLAGEGLIGMSRALFFAGAGCVVVSLWPVDDLATRELMECLYCELGKGANVAGALRTARSRVRSDHPDPRDWAGFIAIGVAW